MKFNKSQTEKLKKLSSRSISNEEKEQKLNSLINITNYYNYILGEEINDEVIDTINKLKKEAVSLFYYTAKESLEIITPYFKLLKEVEYKCLDYKWKYKKSTLKNEIKENEQNLIAKRLKNEKVLILAMCGNYVKEEYIDDLFKTKNKYELGLDELYSVINCYDLYKENKEHVYELDLSYRLDAQKKSLEEFINYNKSLDEYYKEKNADYKILASLRNNVALIDEDLAERAKEKLKFYQKEKQPDLKAIYEEVASYIKNGIQIGDNIIPFTILDFYSICNVRPSEVCQVAKANKDFEVIEVLKKIDKSFYGRIITREEIIAQNNVINGVAINADIVNEIFYCLENKNIPITIYTINVAISRYVKNQPLIPATFNEEDYLAKR